MCGIAGFKNKDNTAIDGDLLERMALSLQHRGPDGDGFHVEESHGLGLAHRRLSIIDLSTAGSQPMCNEDGSVWIDFNGEIYNYLELIPELQALGHEFKSACDTEVIVHAYEQWGPECLTRFNGMFSFVIWDRKVERLFGARDRFGEKPFYYWNGPSRFVFASEIKAILQDATYTPAANAAIIDLYLSHGITDHSKDTFFLGIQQLEPGECFTFERNDLKIWTYWQIAPRLDSRLSDAEAIEKFTQLFAESIRLRFRSDVPVGSCLSGGLDSSTIVTVASDFLKRNGANPMKTFTCSYPQPGFNESSFAEQVIAAAGADAHFITPKETGIAGRIVGLLRYQDEPFATLGVYSQWSVMALARENGVTVLLDGQGADEVLGGYLSFLLPYFADLVASGDARTFFSELRNYVTHYPGTLREIAKGILSPLVPGFIKALRRSSLPAVFADHPLKAPNHLTRNLLTSVMRYNLRAYLRYEDRNSMAHSLEARLPFLDHHLVEFAFGLPNRFKIREATTKWLLRRSMAGRLPGDLLERRDKMGFATPSEGWLEAGERAAITETLSTLEAQGRSWARRSSGRRVLKAFLAGDSRPSPVIWRYFILEQWFRTFIERREGAANV